MPVSQRPAQHLLPAPHCWSLLQPTQTLFEQTSGAPDDPTPHWLEVQQLPALHSPPQHTEPPPHSSFDVHARQEPTMQAVPGEQSLPAQQVAFGLQRFPQHFPPPHCESLTHARHELSMQAPVAPHSDEPQQSPDTQLAVPPSRRGQQTPAPQTPGMPVHEAHLATPASVATQVSPPQAALTGAGQHSPAIQLPPQHRWSLPHWLSAVHDVHW